MHIAAFKPGHIFTRLYAWVVQENGAFTVNIQVFHHLKDRKRGAAGTGEADSIEEASKMIGGIAQQFSIPQACISINLVMENYRDGTRH